MSVATVKLSTTIWPGSMKYSESELIDLMRRMVAIYLESYPADEEELKRFQAWVLRQWGYRDGQS